MGVISSYPIVVPSEINYGFAVYRLFQDFMSANQIVLAHIPKVNSERFILNGVELTKGIDYDYTIWENVVTFNNGVLTNDGHIKVTYHF